MSDTDDQGRLVDDILIALNWKGRYQQTRLLILLASLVFVTVHAMAVILIGKYVSHQCSPVHSLVIDNITYNTDQLNLTYGACAIDALNGSDVIFSVTCTQGYEYAEPKYSSYVTDWDMVCDKEYMADVVQTVIVAGYLCGSLFLSGLADKYGRKKAFMITNGLFFVTSIVTSFVPNLVTFLIIKFISGAFQSAAFLFANVLCVEIMPTEKRALPEQIIAYLWPLSLLFSCLVAYVARDVGWRYIHLILTSLSVYVLVQWWIVDESLRWLCVSKRVKQAEKLVRKIARINGIDPSTALDLLKSIKISQDSNSSLVQNVESQQNSEVWVNSFIGDLENPQTIISKPEVDYKTASEDDSLTSFCQNKVLLKITIASCILWFVDGVTYDGMLLTSFSLVDNFYLGFTLSVLAEFPAGVAFSMLINRLGRKKCVNIFHLTAGVSLMVSNLFFNAPFAVNIPGNYWFALVFSLLGKCAITAAFSAVYLYTPEMFPTSVRNTGYGFSYVASLIGSMIAPFSRTVSRHSPWVPPVVFGALCLAVPLLMPLLPETTGHELPQNVKDMDQWVKDCKAKRTNEIKT